MSSSSRTLRSCSIARMIVLASCVMTAATLGRVSLWEFRMATSRYEANVRFLSEMFAKAANYFLHGS